MFKRLMAVFSDYQRDDLIATMNQGKVGRARTRGKVVPGRYAPYGFTYDKEAGNYRVDEERMRHVGRLFHMVGSEGAAPHAVKSAFQREGVPTPGGGRYWHTGTIRKMICNDVYKAHERNELERLTESGNLSHEVLARLDRNRRYGLAWYNRTRWERTVYREKAIRVTPNEREYAKLGLKAVIHKDGTLEITWKAGKGVSKLCASRRCRAAATTFSSSTLAR
jgi:Recombinase